MNKKPFLKIDQWFNQLPKNDERKMFIDTIDENAGFYALIDFLVFFSLQLDLPLYKNQYF
jgi:hypothetical protein